MPGLIPSRRSHSSVDGDDQEEDIYASPTPPTQPSSDSTSQRKRQRLDHNGTSGEQDDETAISSQATPRVHNGHRDTPSEIDGDQSRVTADSWYLRAQNGHRDTPSEIDGNRSGVTAGSWNLNPPVTVRRPRAQPASHTGAPASALTTQTRIPRREHQPGSIVRVKLTNFVTYTSASFYPGPALNMIIGPNGTGKSTLVCAICLGLGWGPKHLARAKEPGEFVKNGHTECEIEVELKGFPGKRNSIIRRNIRREGNRSIYHINGEASSATNVLALARKYGIQVDNLCHFLPQDRVVEFAGLTAVERLTETLRAAAPEQMIVWHDELKKLRVDQRAAEDAQAKVKQNLTNLEGRQNAQRADVERIRERTDLVKTVAQLEKLRPVAEAHMKRSQTAIARDRHKALEAQHAQLAHECEPALQAANEKKDYKDQIERAIRSKASLVDGMMKSAEAILRKKVQLEKDISEVASERKTLLKNDQSRKNKINQTEVAIRDLEARMKEPPVDFDPAEFNEKKRSKEREQREVEDRRVDVRNGISNRAGTIEERRRQISRAQEELKSLTTQAGQQTNKLARESPDTAKAWRWIQENQSKFRSPVYGPPIVECQIKDKRRVQQIENTMARSEYLAITCTTSHDFKLLGDILYKQLGLSDVYPRGINGATLAQYQAPMTDDDKSRLGLEGWAIDFITGPEPVLAMLCGEKRLHMTGIMSHSTNEQFQALQDSRVTRWADNEKFYEVRKRQEYAGYSSTSTKFLQPAQWWTEEAVDVRIETDLKDNIAGWTEEIEELITENRRDSQKEKDLKQQIQQFEDDIKAINEAKNTRQAIHTEQVGLPTKLQSQQNELKKQKDKGNTLHKEVTEFHEQETALVLKKAQLAIDYSNIVEKMRTEHTRLITACLYQIEATSDLQQLEDRQKSILRELDTKRREASEMKQIWQTLKEAGKAAIRVAEESLRTDNEFREYYNAITEEENSRTPDELNEEIDSQRARLELLQAGDPRTVREYEARTKEIERLQRDAGDNEDTLTSLEQSISSIRAQWEPELLSLVAKISAAFGAFFEKINCAGDVVVGKAGEDEKDFEKWTIDIMVKFREHEKLSQLNSSRQSGGERAVSTIFYLMALQTLSRAPFRVVDEINQGMDPKNERMVHGMMVDVACGTDEESEEQGSQYFLITPKLLTDLKYTPGMKVHCIASGEYVPDSSKELEFGKLIATARKVFARPSGLVGAVGA